MRELQMSANSGLSEAPPTRKPSISAWPASSCELAAETEPPLRGRGAQTRGASVSVSEACQGRPSRRQRRAPPRAERGGRHALDDADLVGNLLRDLLGDELAKLGVDILGLLRGSDLAGADGPD